MTTIMITRYHDFSAGHRVMLGEGACARLHGHNYRVTFKVAAPIDATGHAIEFSAIKSRLCQWLEDNWDHRFLIHIDDPMGALFRQAYTDHTSERVADARGESREAFAMAAQQLRDSIVYLPFHPTTENIAQYLLNVIGPKQLAGTGATLLLVEVSETRKCGAIALLEAAPEAALDVRYETVMDARQRHLNINEGEG